MVKWTPEVLARAFQACRDTVATKGLAEAHRFSFEVWKRGIDAVFSRLTADGLSRYKEGLGKSISLLNLRVLGPKDPVLAVIGGRLPDPATTLIVWSLLFGARVIVKPPGEYPFFLKTLVSCLDQYITLNGAIRVLEVSADSSELKALLKSVQHVLIFGSDETVKKVVLQRVPESITWFRDRESLELILEQPPQNTIEGIAMDVVMYDQSGCLSPHVIAFKGTFEEALVLGGKLQRALEDLQEHLTMYHPLKLEDRARIRLFLEKAKREGGVLMGGSFVPQVVVIKRPIFPGPGFRVVQILPFEREDDVTKLLHPLRARIQGLAAYPEEVDLSFLIRELGPAGYITTPGKLQKPPLLWVEDGVLLPLQMLNLTRNKL